MCLLVVYTESSINDSGQSKMLLKFFLFYVPPFRFENRCLKFSPHFLLLKVQIYILEINIIL